MKNMIKKNQIIIFTVALMLIVAGYMNYTTNAEKTLQTAGLVDTEKYAEIGDATLVSSNALVENENTVEELVSNDEEVKNDEKSKDESNSVETNAGTSTDTNTSTDNEEQYFTQSKIDRDNMYSQMIESYQKLLNNTEISEAQKNIAQEEIKKINTNKNALMIAENLIKNKGFDNVIIFINNDSVNVIVGTKELKQEQIAQIQNIVQRELKVEIENIHISNK